MTPSSSSLSGESYVPPTKEQFEAMSPEQKRVAISHDVLALIEEGKIQARPYGRTCYAQTVSGDCGEIVAVEEITEPCYVCGLGAAFLALLLRGDKQGYYLPGIFPERMARAVETAFEGYDSGGSFPKAERFYASFRRDSERLTAIFENIIANNGEFKPEVSS